MMLYSKIVTHYCLSNSDMLLMAFNIFFITSNGKVHAPWTVKRHFTEPQEKYVRLFYLSKVDHGLSLSSVYINSTAPMMESTFKKIIAPQVHINSGRNSTEVAVTYNCLGRSGISVLWMQMNFMSTPKTVLNSSEPVIKDFVPGSKETSYTIVWSKYCSKYLSPKEVGSC